MPFVIIPVMVIFVVTPMVVLINRVVPIIVMPAFVPREYTYADIEIIVIIPEVVVAVTRIGEQAELQVADIDDNAERVRKSGPFIIVPREIDRGEQYASAAQRIIPVSRHKNIPSRRANIV